MSKLYIMCVDDEPEVLEAVERDLAFFEDVFPLEATSSASEARSVLERIEARGDELAVIFCDHVMPGETGVELLEWMETTEAFGNTKKALLTGQAGLDATIQAVNNANLDFYIQKPWTKENLLSTARDLLTQYVLESGKNPLPYMSMLNAEAVTKAMHESGLVSDE